MIYAIIFQVLIAPFAIKIFINLLYEQKFTTKQFWIKTVVALAYLFLESAMFCLFVPLVGLLQKFNIDKIILERLIISPMVLNPLTPLIIATFFIDWVGVFPLLLHLYCQFPAFLLFFAMVSHNRQYIKKTLVFYLIWLCIVIFLSFTIGETR